MTTLFVPSLRSIAHSSLLARQPLAGPSRRSITTSKLNATRQVLGRITPKRIAVSRAAFERESGQYGVQSGVGTSQGFERARETFDSGLPRKSIWRPIVFCTLLGGGGYTLLALYTNYDTSKWSEKLGGGSWWRRGQSGPSDREIARAKQLEGARQAQKTLNNLPSSLSFLPNVILIPILRIYVLASEFYLNTPSAQLAPLTLIGGMGTVFLMWKVRRLEPFMKRWWLHRPVVFGSARDEWRNCVTMFTSVLSHQSLPHLAFNSFALFSFGAASYQYLSTSPTLPALNSSSHTPHFLAFLLTAGLFSSLSSHLWTNIVRLPSLMRTLRHPARISSAKTIMVHQGFLPSLGASGAIYGALTLTACAYPDSNVGIIFIPFVSIPIGMGVAGMVALDLVGLFRGWRMFDHVAHLSGALFGFIYYRWGREAWVYIRRKLGAEPRGSGLF
ncbi:rhomboid-like protein [Kwoniella heveanensis BCC8398]|uniref:Rhomboid-like protein n=1 Tax=Kwoniella heveanensis BCC8398 TaxID=1296120 RepID=A0A1B9GIV9_9TREE|nr:rhomboid-like protein [Kwoniella heveanensis BCC8398]